MSTDASLDFAAQMGADEKSVAQGGQPSFKVNMEKKQAGQQPIVVKDEEGTLPSIATSAVPAIIRVSGGRTINLGNFNSAKIEVSLSLPVDVDALDAGWQFAYKWVDKKLQEALEDDEPQPSKGL